MKREQECFHWILKKIERNNLVAEESDFFERIYLHLK